MNQVTPFVITISHLFGSGGSEIGKQLAKKLDILYLDSQIISEVAKKLEISEQVVELHDERSASLLETIMEISSVAWAPMVIPLDYFSPSDRTIFECETEIIKRTVKEQSAVILGRGASKILRSHSHHLSVLLHANAAIRKKRIMQLFDVTDKDAVKMIEDHDKKKVQYYRTVIGQEFAEATQYDICLDTGKIGVNECAEIILNLAMEKFKKESAE